MFGDWWNSLGIVTQIFYCIAVPSTLVLLIQTVLMLIGIGDDGLDIDTDIDIDMPDGVFGDSDFLDDIGFDGIDGLKLFTVRGVISFLVVFGWTGVLMNEFGSRLWLTMLISVASGFVAMLFIALIYKAGMKLKSEGNVDNRNAVGASGKVYLTIPAKRSGEGKVQVMIQGSYVERAAVTDDEEAIHTGAEVVVIGVSGQTDLIVRRK